MSHPIESPKRDSESRMNPRVQASEKTPLQAFNRTRNVQLASKVEIAGSGASRSKGLLGRKSMPVGEALWIVPCEAVHTFWMQFALDLVFLDREFKVRKIRKNVPPWRMSACLTAHSVLEFSAGSLFDNLAQPGDQIELLPVSEVDPEKANEAISFSPDNTSV